MLQGNPDIRKDLSSLNGMMEENANADMAPLSEFISMTRVNGPQSIKRYNLRNAVSISGITKPGCASGDAINTFQEVAKKRT